MFQDVISHKFWEIKANGVVQLISFGRVGSIGTSKEKTFGSEELCLLDCEKSITNKLKNGYIEIENSLKIQEIENSSSNDKISNYLTVQFDSYYNKLKANSDLNPIFSMLLKKLENYNFEEYVKNLEIEIALNLNKFWINPDIRKNGGEMLDSIYFEFGNEFLKGMEADAYGIIDWEDLRMHTKSFSLGYSYNFASDFEAVPGITLNFFDALEIFENWDSMEETNSYDDYYEIEGFDDLKKTYLFKGLIILNDTFKKLNDIGLFKNIVHKKGFMFIIGEHDMGEVFPIFAL